MRITEGQLRRIIREERDRLTEMPRRVKAAPGPTPAKKTAPDEYNDFVSNPDRDMKFASIGERLDVLMRDPEFLDEFFEKKWKMEMGGDLMSEGMAMSMFLGFVNRRLRSEYDKYREFAGPGSGLG